MRLLFTFIGELSREENLNYKTQLLLCRIAPSLCQLAGESPQIFADENHPVRKIISSIVVISKSAGSGASSDDYLYKSLKESMSSLSARDVDGLNSLNRVASDLDYIVKLAQIRANKKVITRINPSAAGQITQSKIKAAFFVVTEATKFDCNDTLLYFVLGSWVELLTVALIKFPNNVRVEKEIKRMTFTLLYVATLKPTQSESSEDKIASMRTLLLKKAMGLVKTLGSECLGHKLQFSALLDELSRLLERQKNNVTAS